MLPAILHGIEAAAAPNTRVRTFVNAINNDIYPRINQARPPLVDRGPIERLFDGGATAAGRAPLGPRRRRALHGAARPGCSPLPGLAAPPPERRVRPGPPEQRWLGLIS